MPNGNVTFTTSATLSFSGSFWNAQTVRQGVVNALHNYGFGSGSDYFNIDVGAFSAIITLVMSVDCSRDLSAIIDGLTNAVRSTGYFYSVPAFRVMANGCAGSGGGGTGWLGGILGGGSGGGGTQQTPSGATTYTVVRGDTFSSIARRFGLTVSQLSALNPQVRNINVISVGQVLNIRGSVQQQPPLSVPPSVQLPPSNQVPSSTQQPPSTQPPRDDDRGWFDRTFFDGAGKLTGAAVGVLVVLGAIVVTQTMRD